MRTDFARHGAVLKKLERSINEMPAGPERDQYEANFLRMCARLDKVAENVAARGPFASADEVRGVMEEEIHVALAEFHGGN